MTDKARADRRFQLMQTYEPQFKDVLERVCRRQEKEVGAAARRLLAKRSQAEFDAWLDNYWRTFAPWMRKEIWPLYRRYGQDVLEAALADLPDGATDEGVPDFVEQYVNDFVAWHVDKSRDKVERALQADDPLVALDTAIAVWVTKLPQQLAEAQPARAANQITRRVYAVNQVQYVRWATNWYYKACHYCKSLDGTVASINGFFSASDLPDFRDVQEPPLHRGCQCTLVPV